MVNKKYCKPMELFQRILKIIEMFEDNSQTRLAKNIGISQQTLNNYLNSGGQQKIRKTLLDRIYSLYPQVSRDWLYFGDGEMLKGGSPPEPAKPEPSALPVVTTQAVPIVGFASCGVAGWSGVMTFPVAATAPHMRPDMIAVMATGESMIPAGIGHGHICFCDPHAEPMPGECVYVERRDNLRTLKAFLGRGEVAGHDANPGEIALRGWQDKDAEGNQKAMTLRVDERLVKTIAPVIYVQRRM